MKSFKGYVKESIQLNEAVTTKAIRTEMAICFHWNKAKNKDISDEKALELAEISDDNWEKVKAPENKVGENIVKKLLNESSLSGNAVHYGSGSNSVSAFWSQYGAGVASSSRTPKTDLIIGTKTISLKIGAGQLMSGKGPEALATFYAALEESENSLKKSDKVKACIIEIKKFSQGYINDTITNLKKNDWETAPEEITNIEKVHKETMRLLGSLFEEDEKFQRAFIKEAMTGNVKFGKASNASANYFLVGSKNGNSISFHDINTGDYVDKVVRNTTISVKHKTTSVSERVVGEETVSRRWWSALGLSTKDMTKALRKKAPKPKEDKKNESYNESYDELYEGFLRDVWNKVKSTVTGFIGNIKKMVKRKFKSFLGFLGFEPEVEYKIDLPK